MFFTAEFDRVLFWNGLTLAAPGSWSIMPKKLFRAVYALNFIIQAGFTVVTPAALFIGGGWLLVHKLGCGRWVMIVAILLGVISGLWSLLRFLMQISAIDPTQGGTSDEPGRTQGGADKRGGSH